MKVNNKTRVIFLGSRELGYYALEKLYNNKNIILVGAVVANLKKRWWENDPLEFVKNNNIKQIKHDELKDLEYDLGVSINYWRVLEKEIIEKPKLGYINIHHSYDLELRGRGMSTRKILETTLNKTHGTCLHYTDDGLDTGPIIESRKFKVEENDTAWSLTQKADSNAKLLIDKWFPILIKKKVNTYKPKLGHPLLLNEELELKRQIFIEEETSLEVDLKIKAYDFNGIFEPAYYIKNNKKIHLSYTENAKTESEIYLNNNKYFMTNWQ